MHNAFSTIIKPFTPFVLEPQWQKQMQDELQRPYMVDLAAFIEKEYAVGELPVYPPKNLIFNAFYQTPFDKVRVIIIGQDPYHGIGQAHGLSFSVPKEIKPPPSLQNIFKELTSDLGLPQPSHGCLISWAQQGVLLLNATLTVRQGKPLSHHGKGWERFTDAVVTKLVEERTDPIIFVLWGKFAQDKCRFILDSTQILKHFVLKAAHPSPFSVKNFHGCHHFSKINELLEQQGQTPIDWMPK